MKNQSRRSTECITSFVTTHKNIKINLKMFFFLLFAVIVSTVIVWVLKHKTHNIRPNEKEELK